MDVLMPQLGETVAEGKISKWFVSAGDAVKPGDNLFEIETDKVSMEVPAIAGGTLSVIHVQAGEVAPVGAVVAVIAGKGEILSASKPEQKAARAPPRAPSPAPIAAVTQHAIKPATPMEPFREVRTPERNYGPARLPGGTIVTPLARRLAGESGIDLANVKGSGPHGRIVAADIEGAKKTAAAPVPSRTQAAATVVLTADVEIAQSLALCEQAKLSLADVVIKAWATALERIDPLEQSGIALVGKSRLFIRDAAGKTLSAIAKARRDPGTADDTQGASTAISMPQAPGIASVTDVLQPPHTTMLGIGSPRRAAVEVADGSVKFVDMITVTLSCDRRAVDTVLGAALLSAFKGFVERPVRMIV